MSKFQSMDLDPTNQIPQEMQGRTDEGVCNTENVASENQTSLGVNGSTTESRLYDCTECDELFTDAVDFIRHSKCHNAVTLFEWFKKRFDAIEDAHEHMCMDQSKFSEAKSKNVDGKRAATAEKRYSVDTICGKVLSSKDFLQNHLRGHFGKKLFECEFCTRKFPSSVHLKQHIPIHAGEKPFDCDVCGARFNAKLKLKMHKFVHRMRPKYENESLLLKHRQVHGEEYPYQCIICQKRFQSRLQLSNHKPIHFGPRRGMRCSKEDDLRKHKQVHAGPKPFNCRIRKRSYQCDLCDMKFYEQDDLGKHKQAHEWKERCKFDANMLLPHVNLIKHAPIHSGPFTCEICPKSYPAKSLLDRHKRLHIGNDCGVCRKPFCIRPNLCERRRLYTGEKPYQCEFCAKKFYRKSDLDEHRRIHSGEKDICDRFSRFSFDQSEPIQSVDKESYKCDVCNESFSNKFVLISHTLLEHRSRLPQEGELGTLNRQVKLDLSLNSPKAIHSGLYQCDFCHESFNNKVVLISHTILVHRPRQPQEGELDTLDGQVKHDLSLNPPNPPPIISGLYQCTVCEENFNDKSLMIDHILAHSQWKPQDSALGMLRCNEVVPIRKQVKRELSSDQPKPSNPGHEASHECDICGVKFNDTHDLGSHKLVHTQGKDDVWKMQSKKLQQKVTCDRKFQRKLIRCTNFLTMMIPRKFAKQNAQKYEFSAENFCDEFSRFSLDQRSCIQLEEKELRHCETCMKNFNDTGELNNHKCVCTGGKSL